MSAVERKNHFSSCVQGSIRSNWNFSNKSGLLRWVLFSTTNIFNLEFSSPTPFFTWILVYHLLCWLVNSCLNAFRMVYPIQAGHLFAFFVAINIWDGVFKPTLRTVYLIYFACLNNLMVFCDMKKYPSSLTVRFVWEKIVINDKSGCFQFRAGS